MTQMHIDYLDHGYVKLVGVYGNDTLIAAAARVSHGKGSKGAEQDRRLIHYLYKNRHTSPFEQCNITFEIQMPIFVMRQFVRHRTFRLNEISARYTELPDLFYVPAADKWRLQDTANKQGSSGFLPAGDISVDPEEVTTGALVTYWVTNFSKHAYAIYQDMIEAGVAREMARMVLPVNIYTRVMVNCDLHNLMHFLRLRLHPHAQYEIRVLAQAMYDIAEAHFPVAFEAFNRYKMQMVDCEQNTTE